MRVYSRSTILRYAATHAEARIPLLRWLKEAKRSLWIDPSDIRLMYSSASFIGGGRIVFNVGGNKYRVVVKIRYDVHSVYVRFIGTHAEYDKIDAETV